LLTAVVAAYILDVTREPMRTFLLELLKPVGRVIGRQLTNRLQRRHLRHCRRHGRG
jgi:hypothetical protein